MKFLEKGKLKIEPCRDCKQEGYDIAYCKLVLIGEVIELFERTLFCNMLKENLKDGKGE